VILAGGLVHANDLSTWLTYKSADPTGNSRRRPGPAGGGRDRREHLAPGTTGPSHLISGYDGTPTAFATGPRDHPRAIGQCANFPTQ
jgi:hypothetical protein